MVGFVVSKEMVRFQFGEFEFDPGKSTLSHKGRVVKLQAQPAVLLGTLLTQANRVVSREQLQQTIWGNGTFVDFEKGLNFCVAQVRLALRDDASRPLFIRTVPKQGYQFIAPVRSIDAGGDRTVEDTPPSVLSAYWIPFAALAIGLSGLGLVAVLFLYRAGDRSVPNLAVTRFDADTDTSAARALATSLTDDVVVQLTAGSDGHYHVIGNADVLREPRDKRSLQSIASSLRCEYVVLGQVQAEGGKVLILAHLIRISDNTHISVVRIERNLGSPQALESEAASQIASQFAARMADLPDKAALFSAVSR